MGFVISLAEGRSTKAPHDDFWYGSVSAPALSGVEVTDDVALGVTAFWNAVVIIAGTVGTLPLKIYRKRAGGGKDTAPEHPLYDVLHRRPNPWQTSTEYREMLQGHALCRGNHFSQIVRDPKSGYVTDLVPLHPDKITIKLNPSGNRLIYLYRRSGEPERPFDQDEILHVRGLASGGIIGYSPITLHREAIGVASATEAYAAKFFSGDARPGGVLTHPGKLSDEQHDRLRASWREAHAGFKKAHEVAILENGMEWQKVGLSAEEAQFLQSRQFNITQIAQIMNIPPHMIKDLSRATFNNIEHQFREFVMITVMPWLVRHEQRLEIDLLSEADRRAGYFIKFSVDGLLRGDTATRGEFYTKMFQIAGFSINDILELEDRNPVEGGDQRFVPMNMVPLDQAGDFGKAPAKEPEPAGRTLIETRSQRSLQLRFRQREIYRRLFEDAAGRIVRREVQDLQRLIKSALKDEGVAAFEQRVEEMYRAFPEFFQRQLLPVVQSYGEVIGAAAAEEVNSDFTDKDVAAVGVFGATYTQAAAARHVRSSTGQIRSLVTSEAIEDKAAALEKRVGEWGDRRAAKMGRREAAQAGGAFARAVYMDKGVRQITWRTAGKNCPLCDSFDGRTIAITMPFADKGQTIDPGQEGVTPLRIEYPINHPPLHDGCDCGIVAG